MPFVFLLSPPDKALNRLPPSGGHQRRVTKPPPAVHRRPFSSGLGGSWFFIFIYLSIFSGQGEPQTSTGRQAVRHRRSSDALSDACPCDPTCGLGCFSRLWPLNGRPLLNISLVRGEAGTMRGLNPSVGLLSESSIHTQQECIHIKLCQYQNTFPTSPWCAIPYKGQMMIFNLR